MSELPMENARENVAKHETEEHLLKHALAVSAAMGAMAERFGGDKEHWRAIGYLHDVDFEKYPDEHCHHVRELLAPEGVDDADIRAIESHGWGLCSDVEPQNDMEKCLFTVDELTGIVMAAALMRPSGITDLEVKSLKKKFKDKRFAAGCSREVIQQGADMLGWDLGTLIDKTILAMRASSAVD